MRNVAGLVVIALGTSGCRGDDSASGTGSGAPGATGKGGPTSAVTIRYDPAGGSKVDGAPLHGDPKVCAALKTCCSVSALSLFCGLSQVKTNGDCAQSWKDVKQYADEAHIATPRGCR